MLSSCGDIPNIQKLRSHDSKSQSYKEDQPIQNSDKNEQYFFFSNTVISEQSQNSCTKSAFRAYGIFLNLNSNNI